MSIKKSRFFLLFLFASSATSWAMEDEIDFFNVGQKGTPFLLIDMGTK